MFSTINQDSTSPDDSFYKAPRRSVPNLHYHFVFHAQPEAISDDWRIRFYRFIEGCVQASSGSIVTIKGTDQTVKLRVILNSTSAPDEFARRLKILSANWARRKPTSHILPGAMITKRSRSTRINRNISIVVLPATRTNVNRSC